MKLLACVLQVSAKDITCEEHDKALTWVSTGPDDVVSLEYIYLYSIRESSGERSINSNIQHHRDKWYVTCMLCQYACATAQVLRKL